MIHRFVLLRYAAARFFKSRGEDTMKLFDHSGKYCSDPKHKKDVNATADADKSRKNGKAPWLIGAGILLTLVVIACVILLICFCADTAEITATEPTAQTHPTEAPTEATEPPTEAATAPTEATEPEETEPPVREVMEKFQERYAQNPEFFGWLTIDGTRIDYPVMHSPEDNYKYLHADFDGDYYYPGTPYVDSKCDLDSDNLLIYGHNMNDGSMFHTLMRYENQEFWEENPTISFSDLYEDYEYEILAVFRDRIYLKSDTCFKFYQFIDAADEAEFDYAISQFKEKSIYDTGVDAEYGDKLITLITCAYHVEDGRFVVVARRK